MSFLHFLAHLFYWIRLELAAIERPHLPCSLTRERGRWRVLFGETTGEAREAWRAIRQVLEGRPESDPLELEPRALEVAAAVLSDELANRRERELEEELLERERELERAAGSEVSA
jgi:hypothetical protein